jgi:hypothetical protein
MSAARRQHLRFARGARGWSASIAVAVAAWVVTTAALGASGTSPSAKQDSIPPVYGNSGTRNEPGWKPYSDPESVAVLLGRRPNAPLVREPFLGGMHSMTAMGRAVCRALHRRSTDSLMALCVTDREFRDILWPEFPNSRPASGIEWQDAWFILQGRLHGGTVSAIGDWGGHYYAFLRWEQAPHPDTLVRFKNFKLHNHMVLVARDDQGEVQRFRWLRSIAERKGVYKIYSMQD